MSHRIGLPLLMCTLAATSAQAAPAPPRFEVMPTVNGWTSTFARDVSGNGTFIVGLGTGSGTPQEGFRWNLAGGSIQGVGDVPGYDVQSEAWGISANGQVVVGDSYSSTGSEAFRWTSASGMQPLGDLNGGGFESRATAASATGDIVVGDGLSTSGQEAFRWTAATGMTGLSDLPDGIFGSTAYDLSADGAIIVGAAHSGSGQEAFRWTAGEGMVGLGDLAGGIFQSSANAISADGATIVGGGRTAAGQRAFRWTESGGMVSLGDVSSDMTGAFALDVSADGSIIVGNARYDDPNNLNRPFIWDAAHGMRDLRDLLVNPLALADELQDFRLDSVQGISGDGLTLIGSGSSIASGEISYHAWVAVIPEPALSLPVAGLLLLLPRRQRVRQRV